MSSSPFIDVTVIVLLYRLGALLKDRIPYHLDGTNNPNTETSDSSHTSDLAVDGATTFSQHHWADMSTITHTASGTAGNKRWIHLGGLFRIYKVKIKGFGE